MSISSGSRLMEVNLSRSDVSDGDAAIRINFNAVSRRSGHEAAIWVPGNIVGQRWVHSAIRHIWRWRWTLLGDAAEGVFNLIERSADLAQRLVRRARGRLSLQPIEILPQPLSSGQRCLGSALEQIRQLACQRSEAHLPGNLTRQPTQRPTQYHHTEFTRSLYYQYGQGTRQALWQPFRRLLARVVTVRGLAAT